MSGKRTLYVGNLPYTTTDNELFDLFAPHGQVEQTRVVKDRETGRSKGFGFVEMVNDAEAAAAVEKLNEAEFNGRRLRVSYAVRDSARNGQPDSSQRRSDDRGRRPYREVDGNL